MRDSLIRKTTGMRARTVEELSANYEKLGTTFRQQIRKQFLSRGGPWVSFGFIYQDLADQEFGPSKVMLASFKNFDGTYSRFSYFNIKSKEEAQKVCDLLKEAFELE